MFVKDSRGQGMKYLCRKNVRVEIEITNPEGIMGDYSVGNSKLGSV